MKKLLEKLITFQSDKNHPQEIQKCFDFVVNYLKNTGLKVKTYSSNKIPSLIAAHKPKKHYQYILCGHLDVVPANYPDAYKTIIKGNRLYGRGTADMKGVVAAMIKLMSAIANIKMLSKKEIDVALMLTSDEEVGGLNGVNYLVNKIGYSCDCAIIPDGGKDFKLVLTEKGGVHVKITAKGKAAHGSRPWMGDNAIEKLINVYQKIQKNMPKIDYKNLWIPTVNLGKLNGGDATNKVPSFAKMNLDIRYPRETQGKKILQLIKKSVNKFKGVSYEVLIKVSVMTTSKNNKYIQKILNIAKKQKINLKLHKAHGASDGRFFSAKDIPVIMFRPVGSESHVDNEWIDLKSLQKFYQILKDFLQN